MIIERLVSIADLSVSHVAEIIETALAWETRISQGDMPWPPLLTQQTVGLIFLEPSTRTRIAFERAAQVIGFNTVIMEKKGSSFEKGETMEDTILNLKALGVGHFVIRTPYTGDLATLDPGLGVRIISGGDGTGEHPTQALLDLATLTEKFSPSGQVSGLRGLKLAIVGDLRHSRVLGSWLKLAPLVGIELSLLSPQEWLHPLAKTNGASWSDDKADALKGVSAIMALRVQKERITDGESAVELEEFKKRYQIKASDLGADSALLHPGPVNWGIELEETLRSDKRSLILRQVSLGLATRSVILAAAGRA